MEFPPEPEEKSYEVFTEDGKKCGICKGRHPLQAAKKGFSRIKKNYPDFQGEMKFYVKDVNTDERIVEYIGETKPLDRPITFVIGENEHQITNRTNVTRNRK